MARVLVVTPCYRLERYVGETIRSVLAQDITDWELVVIDDASPDASFACARAIAGADPRIQVVAREANGGVSVVRNQGAALGKASDYVLFLDGDDEIEPTMLRRLASELDAHPAAVAIYADAVFIDEHGTRIAGELQPRLGPRGPFAVRLARDVPTTPPSAILTLAGIIPSATLIRRSTFDKVGGFDEGFGHHMEDADLFMRLALEGEIRFLDARLLRHRRHPAQNTSTPNRHLSAQEHKFYDRWRQRAASDRQLTEAIQFYDRQFALMSGWDGAKRRLRKLDIMGAARFYAGAVRRVGRSFLPRR